MSRIGLACRRNILEPPSLGLFRNWCSCLPSISSDLEMGEGSRPSLWRYLRSWAIYAYRSRETYDHIEICFTGTDSSVAYTALEKEGVLVRDRRTFVNSDYEWIFLATTADETRRVRDYLQRLVDARTPYDFEGPLWMPLQPRREADHTRFWCSSLAVSALQQIGVFSAYPINVLDIDDIVSLLSNHPRREWGVNPTLWSLH